jgi:rubrerythrin
MEKLSRTNRDKVIDVLDERLTFERATVVLYDTILERMRRSSEPEIARMLPTMQAHRDEEKEHEEWLEEQIRAVGGDAHAKTEHGRLVEAESEGLEKVVKNDADLSHDLHALLTAELVDNAGWEMLIQLADEADDVEAREEFKKRLREEQDHLVFVRRAVAALASRQVLGRQVQLPISPTA